jgi:hypothetical protein
MPTTKCALRPPANTGAVGRSFRGVRFDVRPSRKLTMAFIPKLTYWNLASEERAVVDALNNLKDLFVNLIGNADWVALCDSVGCSPEARRVAFQGAWGMLFVPESPFGCFDIDGCWATTSPRLDQIRTLKLVAELSPCDPYGEYVNFPFYPILVPDPC